VARFNWFWGNANGFTVLTGPDRDRRGLRISYATLGAFMKYRKFAKETNK
jgi:hypothetical protein